MTVDTIRQDFPILDTQVYGKKLVYLDNAATSQRPRCVVDRLNDLSLKRNANIHRAVHKLAVDATEEYEKTRDFVQHYLNAEHREEIIFTSGTTASINLLAFSFGEAFVKTGDEIVIAQSEHHSDIVPWQMMCQRKGATIKVIPVDETGHLMVHKLPQLVTEKTRLVCVAHISNVLGLVNPVNEIITFCHSVGCPVFVDGAQGIVHCKVDLRQMDCDFYAFSGHKVYAATGTGVLYGKKKWLEKMPPYMGGGEMIENVSFERTSYAPLPGKFEAGTQNFTAIPTLVNGLQYADNLRNPDVEKVQSEIISYMLDELISDKRIKLYGKPSVMEEKIPLFSISVEGVHHEDLALILDKMGIAVRSGQMCAEPLMDRFAVSGMLRVSFAPYNTLEEAHYFIECLHKAINML